MPKLVEIVDLVTNFYTYEGVVRALNRISLTIEHGVTFGLVGESGCEKYNTWKLMFIKMKMIILISTVW